MGAAAALTSFAAIRLLRLAEAKTPSHLTRSKAEMAGEDICVGRDMEMVPLAGGACRNGEFDAVRSAAFIRPATTLVISTFDRPSPP